jgi:hypothetical protein
MSTEKFYDDRPVAKDTATNGGSEVTIGATSATLVAANTNRLQVVITNTHATQTLTLNYGGTAVAGAGIKVVAGQTWVEDKYLGQINAIASGAGRRNGGLK